MSNTKKLKKTSSSSLTTGLLDEDVENSVTDQKKHESNKTTTPSNENKSEVSSDLQLAYANNQPKIMLETINARTITVCLHNICILLQLIEYLTVNFLLSYRLYSLSHI